MNSELNTEVGYEEYGNNLLDIIAKSGYRIYTEIHLKGVSKHPLVEKSLQIPRNIRAEKVQYNGNIVKAKILKYVTYTHFYDIELGIKSSIPEAIAYFKYIFDILKESKSSEKTIGFIEFHLALSGDRYYRLKIGHDDKATYRAYVPDIYLPYRTIKVGTENIDSFPITHVDESIEAFILGIFSLYYEGIATYEKR